MPTAWSTFPIKFEGGWITSLGRLDQGIQAPGSATILQNYEVSVQGGYERILGYEKFSSDPVPGSGLITGVVALGFFKSLVLRGGSYYLSLGSEWTSKLSVTGGAVKARHDSFNFSGQKKTVIVDGVNRPVFYNHSTDVTTLDGSASSDVLGATHVKVFKNHVFFAKGRLLVFTAPYEETNYAPGDGAGVINIGSTITDMIVFRDQLIVFAVNKIMRISGDTSSNFLMSPITNDTGCLRPDTAQEVGGDIMYLGPDGIRWLSATERNGDFGLSRASQNIQNEINKAVLSSSVFTSLPIRYKNQYRLFSYQDSQARKFAEGFCGTKFSDQDATNVAWSHLVGMKVYTADNKQFDSREVILFSSDTDYLYRMESGSSFDGFTIPSIFRTPDMPITDPRVRKTFYKHSLYAYIGGVFNLTIGLKLDYREKVIIQPSTFTVSNPLEAGGVWGVGIWGEANWGSTIEKVFVNQTVGSGFTVALEYVNNSVEPPFKLDHAVLEYGENERR